MTSEGEPRATASDVTALARDAVIWGLPLVLFGRYLDAATDNGVPFNRFLMSTEIATPRSRSVGPNIDTLNGLAWLDLTVGPQVIGVPDMGDRYYSIQLQDMYMNSFAYIGRRTTGTSAGAFAITPPGFTGTLPVGVTEIKAPTSRVLAFVRTLVLGRADLARVRALNSSFSLGPLSAFPDSRHEAVVRANALDGFQPASRRTGRSVPLEDVAAAGPAYFDELDRLVRTYPPAARDLSSLARFAPLGIGTPEAARRGPALAAGLSSAVPAGLAVVRGALRTRSDNGWSRRENVAPFIEDPVQRAANNIYGPGTQVAEESVFFNMRLGTDGSPLSGARRYRLRFTAGQLPPVDAFWSLTLYDGKYFLVDNPIDRYGVTSHSERLHYGPDGSLEILIQADPPDVPDTNWLPAPRDQFQLVFRTYQPRQPLLDGTYAPAPLDVVG
ncbi:Uncharacterized conserved protein [Parafrankia irregularis]|uniref:Uncharacterized conserved protein n=1 Tax=Parafrankia irregularis TaxID=795642 RepID=A0A0S4QMD8_9ACTN|nr:MULTISPECIES: DUF1254 domain-containing protein [Parafrankia]MBE3201338.1 DUF1254 domain-containing protein [Parafrankia sp. CH37]CUU56207.1 Uncharacterized conserved protein [Parafrankia irregularis]